MKIQCDACGGAAAAAATVFCCADEAALCDACDRRVHHANKLAGNHRRFSLIDPLSSSSSSSSSSGCGKADPLCDLCKERSGFVFCQEDRAILCRDCDDMIHSANDLTMNHNRFLLAGVRLSAAPVTSSSSSSSSSESNSRSPDDDENVAVDTNSKSGTVNTSISEYLTKVCPGWHVEDLLIDDDVDTAIRGFSKDQKEVVAFRGADLDGVISSAATEIPRWVPLVPQLPPLPPEIPAIPNAGAGAGAGAVAVAVAVSSQWTEPKEPTRPSYGVAGRPGRERWSVDDAVTVPQISPQAPSNKRTRTTPVWYY